MAFSQSPNALVNRFQCVCYKYLKLQERERLTDTLRCFERSHDVAELVDTMATILDTSEKRAAIYPVVHELIPASCRKSYQEMLHGKLSPEENGHSPKMMHRSFSSLPSDDSSVLNNSPDSSNTINVQKVIHIQQSTKDGSNLGFRLCYCEISAPGFFINSMEPEFAEWSGFEIGDELVAVNDISVHNWQMNADQLLNVVAIQSQQRTGVNIQIQRLMFSPQKLTTDGPCVLQYVYWYDIENMTFHRKHTPKCPAQLRHTRMKMQDSTTGRMGLNIRGGREFMCGIYISKIERDGLADRCGLRVGDQILTVNGLNLIDIPYREACRQMAYEDTLDFVVRYTGQFPIFTDTPQNRSSSRKSKDHHLPRDAGPYRSPTRNYPYSNGRVDPVGSCSPGTIHSYKMSDPTDDIYLFKKGVHSNGTSYIYNPLCSDNSSLLSYLPNSPSSEPTSANDMECRRRAENIQVITDEPPIPPPRTGKPNLEKFNRIIGKKTNATTKPHQSSRVVPQEDICSQFPKVEVETVAIVHQSANDPLSEETLKDGDSLKPSSEGKVVISKPPRKHKKKGINNTYDDEKAKTEIKTAKEETTKLEPQNNIPILKSETKTLNQKPQSIEQIKPTEQIEPVKVEYSSKIPDITIASVHATESENNLKPCIEIEPAEFITPEITVEPIDSHVHFMKPEVTIEPELLTIHREYSSMHDDDDRLSYISSMSMEYDGENFIMKWPLSEDESMYSNDIHSSTNKQQDEIRWPDSSISSAHVGKCLAGNTPNSTTEPVSLPLEKLPSVPEVSPVTTAPVVTIASSLPLPLPSAQNATERGNSSRAKRHTENGRFQNSAVRTMNSNLTAKEENSENNPYEMLKKMANVILTREEIRDMMQYISEYKEQNDVERLVSRLLEILNNPEKHLLLNQIRELVSPFDRGRYDSMLSFHETQHFSKKLDYKDIFTGNGERGTRSGLKEEQSILARVQCRRKQLDAQMELLESLKQIKPKMYMQKEEDLNLITVYVSKNIRTLGISVTGGADCKRQQEIMIEEVHAGGAAAETKRIKPGMSLVSVDDEDIETASHRAGVYAIRRAFTDRKKPYMKLVLRKQVETERWPTS